MEDVMEDFIIEIYNAADETINFGTRCIDLSGNLYESVTLVVITQPDTSELVKLPHITSFVEDGKVFLTLDRKITIFADQSCSQILFDATFDLIIDTICLCGKYLLMSLRNGVCHILDMDSLQIASSIVLKENTWIKDEYFIESFAEANIDGIHKYFLMNKKGALYSITIEENENAEPIFKNETVYEFHKPIQVAGFNNKYLAFNFDDQLATYNIDDDEVITLLKGFCLKRIYKYDNNSFVGLTMDGNIILICTMTYTTMLVQHEYKFNDLIFYENNNEYYCLVSVKTEQGYTYMKLLNYYDFSEIYSIKLTTQGHYLVKLNDCNDDQLFVSLYNNHELRVQQVCKTLPEHRLERLLRKQSFDEAELFAKQFDLDLTVVNKARAQALVDKNICNSEEITKLLTILTDLDDYFFQVNCCLNVFCSNHEDVRKVLSFGSTLNMPRNNQVVAADMSQPDIKEAMCKFNIYTALRGCNNEEFDSNNWTDFCSSDLSDSLYTQLRQQNMKACIILYIRMDDKIINFTESDVNHILCLLDKMPFQHYLPFLKIFIPKTLTIIPKMLDAFVQWTRNYIYSIEKNEYVNFPDNAIYFIKSVVQLFNVHTITKVDEKITNIVQSLNTIQILKNNYMIYVPLKQSLQGPVSLVHVLLTLDIENIDDLLQNFVIKYLVENHFDHNVILFDEIKELITYREYSIHIIFSIWKCICSAKCKLTAMLLILQYSNTPWCPTIRAMIKEALKINHPLSETIKIEVDREPIYIVLNNPKYKLRKETHGTIDFNLYPIKRIIHCNEPTMLEDVFTVCISDSLKPVVAHQLLQKYINENGTTLKLIKGQSPKELINFLKFSTGLMLEELQCDCFHQDNKKLKQYINIMKIAFNEAAEHIVSICDKTKINNNLKHLTTYMKIRKHFSSNISITDIQTKSKSIKIFDILLNEALQYIKPDVNEAINICYHISSALEIPIDEVLLKLCEKNPDLNLLNCTANYVYKVSQNKEIMCLLPTLIMQSIGSKKINFNLSDSCSSLDDIVVDASNIPIDLNLMKNCIKSAKRIIASCLINFNAEEAYEVFNWIHGTYSPNFWDDCENIVFKNVYEENNSISFNTIDAIRDVFTMYARFTSGGDSIVNTKYLLAYTSKVPEYSEDEFEMEINTKLTSQIENLCNNGAHLTACNLILCLKQSLQLTTNVNPAIIGSLTKILLCCNNLVIQKVFAATKIDETLAFNLLLYYNYEKATKIIKQALSLYKFDLEKFKVIGQLGIKLVQYLNKGDTSHLKLFERVILLVKWWMKIENPTITYKNFTVMPNDQLLESLMQSGHFTKISEVSEFCMDFNLDVTPYYNLLLKVFLLNWKPKYKVVENSSGKRCLVMENNEVELFDDCLEVIKLIPKKETLYEFVSKLRQSINMYYYEVFLCILKIIEYLNNKDVKDSVLLLNFLKSYPRVSSPSDNESEEWFTIFPDVQHIDPLSEWRLPFTATLFTRDIWNILRPEINLNNYKTWFHIISIFRDNLKKDDICTYAVKEVVSSGMLKSENPNEWALYPKHTDLFELIDKCIEQISDLERATSVAYHLTLNTPQGSDQVNAAKLSYKYAQLYNNSCHKPENEEIIKAYVKVTKKYHSFATMHILHTYKLTDKKYLDLVGSPNELIEALYADNRIIKNPIAVKLECPNINAAADEIAELYSIDILEKRLNMIKSWIADGPIGDINLDESICVTPVLKSSDIKIDDVYIKRVTYMCMSGDLEVWQKELWLFGVQQPETISYMKHRYNARALTCFCAITNEEDVSKFAEITHVEIMYHAQKLLLLHDLQCLGVKVDLESFDKKNMLLKLAKDLANPLSLKIMASICTIFTIHNVKYWELIIKNMIKLKMVDEIKSCIPVLSKASLTYKQFYIDAWQCVIDHSFANLHLFVHEENFDTICIENMYYIQSCPVLWRLNLKDVYKKCIELKRMDLAALIVQYFKDDEQATHINELIQCMYKKELISQLESLFIHGLTGINYVINIIRDEE